MFQRCQFFFVDEEKTEINFYSKQRDKRLRDDKTVTLDIMNKIKSSKKHDSFERSKLRLSLYS